MKKAALTGFAVALLIAVNAMGAGRLVSVDQLGYKTTSPKLAFVAQRADSFFVRDTHTGAVVYHGGLRLWKANDPSTGKTIYSGDFSSFKAKGEYVVMTSQGDSSFRFMITDSVYDDAYRKAMKGFYFQRCGVSLLRSIAGLYEHTLCHGSDGYYHSTTDSTGFHFAAGGWHDAGDYGKYVVNAGITVGTLLMAYEYFPNRFAHDDLGIPESGNEVPDILDEVRYELEWLLNMQRSDGGVLFKLTKTQFESFLMPQNDPGTRYLYQVSTTATGDFAAVAARAARVYGPLDQPFAQKCRAAAEHAWGYLKAHSQIVPQGGFHNPPGTATGEYGDSTDADERLWASAELLETTGDVEYLNYYLLNYTQGGLIDHAMWWQDVGPMAHLTYLWGKQAGIDEPTRAQLRQSLIDHCENLVAKRNASGYRVVLQPGEYSWGSNSVPLNEAILLILGYSEVGNQSFYDAAFDQLHYVFGANVYSRSYVTGLGSYRPMQPHHRPSASDGVPEPVPGLLVGGPDQYRDDAVLSSLFTSSTPPALCYADSTPSYASNEIAINWNAPLVFVAGYFNGTGGPTGVEYLKQGREFGYRLDQNFPNPFNGTTRLTFSLPAQDEVNLNIIDILGRSLVSKSLGVLAAGEHQISWNARDLAGAALSTGVYFLYVSGRDRSRMRKMILVN